MSGGEKDSDDKMWVWSNFQLELDNKIRSEYAKAERLRSELASAQKVIIFTSISFNSHFSQCRH